MFSSEINVTPFSATDPVKATVTSVGGASAGGTASSNKPTITGTGEPGQVVNLYDGVRWLGSTTVASDGTWSIAAPNALKAGNHSFTAICVGADGVNGLSSEPVSVKVPAESSTIPPTPAIGGVIDNVGPVKGNVASGGSTDDPKPVFTGSGAHAGDIITIKDGSAPIGSAIVKPDGTWSVTPDVSLGNGPHSITAVEKNPSTGATSSPSPVYPITVDATVPNPPAVHITDPTTGGNVPNGGITGNPSPVISGTGKPGDIVTITDNGTPIGSTTVKPDGTWTFTPTPSLGNGSHNIGATETNPATGATSTPSTGTSINVDASVPAAPAIGGVIDNVGPVKGNVASGGSTDDSKPIFTGSGAHAGDIVIIKDGSAPIGSAIVKPDGTWSVTPDVSLGNGLHNITAVGKNPGTGATSSPSPVYPITVDTSVPAAPVIAITDNVGPVTGNVASGGTTDDTRPTISGSHGKPGDIVTVSDNGLPIGSATVDASGNWSVTPVNALGNGAHNITAVEKNPATGATGPASAGYPITVDTMIPTAPAISSVVDHTGAIQGNIANGGTTDETKPIINGTGAKSGDIVTVSDNGSVIGSATVGTDGKWSFTPATALANGSHSITATEKNPATGATSPASAGFGFTIAPDVLPPSQTPTITGVYDNSGANLSNIPNGGTTSDSTPLIKGTGHPGDIIVLYDGSAGLVGAIVDGSGNWSTSVPSGKLGIGSHSLHAVASGDGQSNSPSSNYWTVTIGTSVVVPSTPSLTRVDDHVGPVQGLGAVWSGQPTDDPQATFNGNNAGALNIVKVYDNGALIGSTTADGSGNWTFTPANAVVNGTHNMTFTATNPTTGAVGASSSAWAYVVDTTVPSTPSLTRVDDHVGPVQGLGAVFPNVPTDDPQAVFNGNNAGAGNIVKVHDNGALIGSTTADGSGSWVFKPASAVSNGTHNMTFTATKPITGAVSPSSNAWAYVVDTTVAPIAPQTPTITGLWDTYGSQQGNLLLQGQYWTTDDQRPTLTGTGRAGETIIFYSANPNTGVTSAPLGSTVVASNGTWSVQPLNRISYGYVLWLGVAAVSASGQKSVYVPAVNSHGDPTSGLFAPQAALDSGINPSEWMDRHQNWVAPVITGISSSGNKITIFGTAPLYGGTLVYMDGTAIALGPGTDSSGNFIWTSTTPIPPGMHNFYVNVAWGSDKGLNSNSVSYNVTSTFDAPVEINRSAAHSDAEVAASAHDDSATTHHAVDANGAFTGTTANETVDLNVDPQAYFAQASAHIAGGGGVDTLALSGSHQILDLTALTGTTAAAKISGVEVFDLGGHQNTLKVSLLDVLNLGEQDLFIHDGKQQVVVKGATGDAVDLSNTHVAGVADGQWEQHGTAQVGGVTYAVYEHSGAHVELLVQQGVATTVHQ